MKGICVELAALLLLIGTMAFVIVASPAGLPKGIIYGTIFNERGVYFIPIDLTSPVQKLYGVNSSQWDLRLDLDPLVMPIVDQKRQVYHVVANTKDHQTKMMLHSYGGGSVTYSYLGPSPFVRFFPVVNEQTDEVWVVVAHWGDTSNFTIGTLDLGNTNRFAFHQKYVFDDDSLGMVNGAILDSDSQTLVLPVGPHRWNTTIFHVVDLKTGSLQRRSLSVPNGTFVQITWDFESRQLAGLLKLTTGQVVAGSWDVLSGNSWKKSGEVAWKEYSQGGANFAQCNRWIIDDEHQLYLRCMSAFGPAVFVVDIANGRIARSLQFGPRNEYDNIFSTAFVNP